MKKEFTKRLLSSIIILPITLFFIFKGSYLFAFFLCLIFFVTSFEWLKMSKKLKILKFFGICFLFLSILSAYFLRITLGYETFLFVILISILTDLGGYIFGKTFKGPKLTKISPNKTYSGVIGSFVVSLIGGSIYQEYMTTSTLLWGYQNGQMENGAEYNLFLLLFILIISLISQSGDLMISYFKRLAKIKNTGSILPGHGGLLDRIDGIIFAVPFSYIILNLTIYWFMKKKIAILGSTGSIGKILVDILSKDKKNFEVKFLSAEKNYKKLFNQAKLLNVKNLIITNKKAYSLLLKLNKSKRIRIYNNFECIKKIISSKVDYCMCAISGLAGLVPTYEMIKHSKTLAIANKESIICGWNLLEKEIKKNKTKFIPVDSEHFSIWFGLNEVKNNNVNSIYITASGGPLINTPLKKFKNIKTSQALKHPNWKMGKKISIDSSTMMNKVFEVIEAKNIFNISYDKIKILVHQKSYVHALIKFNNGLIKIIAHDTNMKIPIFNTIYLNSNKIIKTSKMNIKLLNNLNFKKVDNLRFPLVNLIKKLPNRSSLFETALVSVNDELVDMYLKNKIKYTDISKKLLNFLNKKEFLRLKEIQPKKIDEIIKLNQYVRIKINALSVYK